MARARVTSHYGSVRSPTISTTFARLPSVCPAPPLIIVHSMGGLIVQKYLERYDAPAGVLMSSIPPQGNLGNALRWIRQRPSDFAKMTITGKALPYITPPQLARERFFSPHTPALSPHGRAPLAGINSSGRCSSPRIVGLAR